MLFLIQTCYVADGPALRVEICRLSPPAPRDTRLNYITRPPTSSCTYCVQGSASQTAFSFNTSQHLPRCLPVDTPRPSLAPRAPLHSAGPPLDDSVSPCTQPLPHKAPPPLYSTAYLHRAISRYRRVTLHQSPLAERTLGS